MIIWFILRLLGKFYSHLDISSLLEYCTKKNPATLDSKKSELEMTEICKRHL
jgi:oligoribonuclease (3'-5' exoribonuclease)